MNNFANNVQLPDEANSNEILWPLGVDDNQEHHFIHLENGGHVLTAGFLGSGNTTFKQTGMTTLTQQLTYRELRLILISGSIEYESTWLDSPFIFRLALTLEKALEALQRIQDEILMREALFNIAGKESYTEYIETGKDLPLIVCVIDDLSAFVLNNDVDEKTLNLIRRSLGWLEKQKDSLGISLVVTAGVSTDLFDPDCYKYKVGFTGEKILTEQTASTDLQPGQMIVETSDTIRKLQVNM